jgi:hypothetical protein
MISIDVLGKMVRTLSSEQLAKLPIDKLPEDVPEVIYTIGTPEKNAVLEDLLIRRDSERMNRQVADMEQYGKEVADAFHLAESNRLPPLVIEFAREVQSLLQLVEQPNDSAADAKIAEKTLQLKELMSRIARSPLLTAEQTLMQIRDDQSTAVCEQRIERALRRLEDKLAPASLAIAKYQELRVSLAHKEMSALRKRVKKESAQQEILQEEIDALNKDLQQQRTFFSRALGKYHSSGQYTETQDQIKQLIARKKMSEVPIDDKNLVDWLDAIVEASLCNSKQTGVHASRVLLLSLLELYCRQQEESAMQIAQNPFSQIDPKQAIKFILASEQFILDYFSKKQEEGTTLFRSTAESRRERLDVIMDGLIKELKRNLRKLKI